jgi:hypothetical protein
MPRTGTKSTVRAAVSNTTSVFVVVAHSLTAASAVMSCAS